MIFEEPKREEFHREVGEDAAFDLYAKSDVARGPPRPEADRRGCWH